MPTPSGSRPSSTPSSDDTSPPESDLDTAVREILTQYVDASSKANMPQTSAVTQALARLDAESDQPLPPAAVRLGEFLLRQRGRS